MSLSRRPATLALALLVLALAGLLGWLVLGWQPELRTDPAHATLELAATPTGGDFVLHGAAGPVALADLRGKVVLLYFGYTWCPDICPTNLALIALALRQLTPAELARVAVLFVSVDPARDTRERLAEYAAYFHPQVQGITGSEAEVAAAAALYGAAYRRFDQPNSAMGYTVDHSAFTYLIDPAGRLAGTLGHATPAEQIAREVRRLLAASG